MKAIVVGAQGIELRDIPIPEPGPEQVAKLDAASDRPPVYPYWHQRGFTERNPLPIG